ncbi:hypothetical protein F4677DRAFT_461347 [Hypoxylon crocopeplum]|nr:hypothetical protein F4677DRAFT_461347 [Hypoxylon crocopeplum]
MDANASSISKLTKACVEVFEGCVLLLALSLLGQTTARYSLPWADNPDPNLRAAGTYNTESAENASVAEWLEIASISEETHLELSEFDSTYAAETTDTSSYFERNDYFYEGPKPDSLGIKDRSTLSLLETSDSESKTKRAEVLRRLEIAQQLRHFSQNEMRLSM